jgi:transposase
VVLYFDRSGFCIWAKRLEAGRFVSDWSQVRTREMDWTGLKLLLEGIEPGRRRKRYQHVKISTPEPHTPQVMR